MSLCSWLVEGTGGKGSSTDLLPDSIESQTHLRPPHYGAGLINSFSQLSLVAPISCLLFLISASNK